MTLSLTVVTANNDSSETVNLRGWVTECSLIVLSAGICMCFITHQ